MANTGAIIILIIGIILFLVALGVGLYLYFRNRKKTPDTGTGNGNNGNTASNPPSNPPNPLPITAPTGPTGGGTNNPPSNPLPLIPPAGPTGSTGPTGPANTFAVSPDIEFRPFSGVWYPGNPNLSVVSTDSNTACNNYLFKYSNFISPNGVSYINALVWQGDNKSIVYAEGAASTNFNNSGVTQLVTVKDTSAGILNSDAANWSYDSSQKTWCLTNHPNVCLFYQQFSQLVFSAQNVGDRSFQWDYGSLPSNFAPCKT